MRGRLIHPYQVEIAQVDRSATDADPLGPATEGYDDVFREPALARADAGDRVGEVNRVEAAPITLHAQIESRSFEQLMQMYQGNAPRSQIDLVFHFRELEANGLVDANGLPMLYIGDRLHRILDKAGNLVQTIPNPPGLFAMEILPRSFGFGGRNLLVVSYAQRDQANNQLS